MDLPNPKELAKLANACRKAGISHFKCGDFEFTLGPKEQPRAVNSASKQTSSAFDPVSEGELTEDQLLMWSSMPVPSANPEEGSA